MNPIKAPVAPECHYCEKQYHPYDLLMWKHWPCCQACFISKIHEPKEEDFK